MIDDVDEEPVAEDEMVRRPEVGRVVLVREDADVEDDDNGRYQDNHQNHERLKPEVNRLKFVAFLFPSIRITPTEFCMAETAIRQHKNATRDASSATSGNTLHDFML